MLAAGQYAAVVDTDNDAVADGKEMVSGKQGQRHGFEAGITSKAFYGVAMASGATDSLPCSTKT